MKLNCSKNILIMVAVCMLAYSCGDTTDGGSPRGTVEVTSLSPSANAVSVSKGATVSASFDKTMESADETNFIVHGSLSGRLPGTYRTDLTKKTLNFVPEVLFKLGEEVEVTLTTDLESTTGEPLDAPFVYRFRIEAFVVNDSGSGNFSVTRNVDLAPLDQPSSITSGDWNGDGDIDLAVTNETNNTVKILDNNTGIGDFSVIDTVALALLDLPSAITAGDFDGDGDLDLAVTNAGNDTVKILDNRTGEGDFVVTATIALAILDDPSAITQGDWDGDGDLDLAVTNETNNTVKILDNNTGIGDFNVILTVDLALQDLPSAITAGDFDGDGDLDLAVTNAGNDTVKILDNRTGVGDFPVTATVALSTLGGDDPSAITQGDWDGDGDLDLAVANEGNNSVKILDNTVGTGDFSVILTVALAAQDLPSAITAGDWDGDGDLDLAVTNAGNDTVKSLINDGVNTADFDVLVTVDLPALASPSSMTAGDYNGQTGLDLAVTNQDINNVSVIENQ